MKKITLLFTMLLLVTFSWQANAQFPEGFETAVPPTGWTSFVGTNGEGTGYDWETSTTAANGSAAAYVRYENVDNSAEDWLVTPQFTPSAVTPILTFMQRQGFSGASYGTVYTVRVSTMASQTTHADFTTIDSQVEDDFNTIYTAHNIDLSAYIGTPIYVAFVMTQDDGDNWYIDDVNMILDASAPDCADNPTPADVATGVVVTDGAITIAWDAPSTGDPATAYNVWWGTTSGDLTDLGTISGTTINITNSNYSTTYYWSIVPSNSGGLATGCPEWSFTTEDAPPPPANDDCANATTISCGDSLTGETTIAATGSSATSCQGSIGNDVWYKFVGDGSELNVTVTTTSTGTNPEPQVDIYMSTDGTCDGFTAGTCDGSMSATSAGVNPTTTTINTVDGTTYYIAVGSWINGSSDIDFDLTVSCVTCIAPTSLTASVTDTIANLGWTDTATTWNVEWGADGFTQGAGTTINGTTTNPHGISGLTAETPYDFYVQSDCGGGDLSAWSGPYSFTTSPAPIAPPYMNDFSTFPGTGWYEAGSGLISEGPSGTFGDWNATDFANDDTHPNGSGAKINLYSDVDEEWLISPDFDLSGGTTFFLNLDVAVTDYNDAGVGSMGSDDEVHVLVTTDNGVTWTSVTSWTAANQPGNSREAASETNISAYAGGTVKFAIWATDGSVDDSEDYDFHVDNFQITTSTLSLEDNVIEGFSIYPNPVNDILNFNALENIEAISVYNLLGQEVLARTPNAVQSEINMTNLPTGVYVVKIKVGEQLGTYKVVKE